MALIRTQVIVAQVCDRERMVVGGQKTDQPVELGCIGPDRVRAAVRFELKPAEVFSGGGLQIECHIEAVCMLPYSWKVGALRVYGSSEELEPRGDEFGFDPEFTDRLQGVALWFYRKYWRVEVDGIQNVPARGRALLVANHAGIVPYDGAMIRTAIIAEHPQPRHARILVVDWAFAMPFTNMLLAKTGNVLAHPHTATALLHPDKLARLLPAGLQAAAKRYRERYRVRRLGRGGFVQVALRTGSPIIPVAVVGSEEI